MFAKRQFIFLPLALGLMLAISLASPRHVRRLALLVFCGSLVLLAATFVIGSRSRARGAGSRCPACRACSRRNS
jgi:cell division protein FtsW (lipid II flippase)